MPKGGLLHTHSGGITDAKWIIETARKYKESYIYVQKDNDQYIFGQMAFFQKVRFRQVLLILMKN